MLDILLVSGVRKRKIKLYQALKIWYETSIETTNGASFVKLQVSVLIKLAVIVFNEYHNSSVEHWNKNQTIMCQPCQRQG